MALASDPSRPVPFRTGPARPEPRCTWMKTYPTKRAGEAGESITRRNMYTVLSNDR